MYNEKNKNLKSDTYCSDACDEQRCIVCGKFPVNFFSLWTVIDMSAAVLAMQRL